MHIGALSLSFKLADKPVLLFTYTWVEVKKDGFMPFPGLLAQSEIQKAASRIRTYLAGPFYSMIIVV